MSNSSVNHVLSLLSLGIEISLSVVIPLLGGIVIGKFLDNKLNSSPVLLIVLIILGLVVSGYQIYRLIAPYLRGKK
ncbi:MAG: AtpZ/AtpI family protein [bacterium]